METDSPEELENNLCSLISYPSKQDYRIKYNLTSVLGTLFYTMHKKSSLGRCSLCLLVVYKLYQKLKTFFLKKVWKIYLKVHNTKTVWYNLNFFQHVRNHFRILQLL